MGSSQKFKNEKFCVYKNAKKLLAQQKKESNNFGGMKISEDAIEN